MKKPNENSFMSAFNAEKSFYVANGGKQFHLYLGGIEEPEEYHSWCQVLRTASPMDDIFIHINSGGGRIDTTTQIIQAMQECQGTIFASVEGRCCSAATMIFLACDQYQLSPYTYFMVHNFSGGTIGKGNEMQSQVEFEKKWFNNIAYSIYNGFLTDEEIGDMLRGVDYYFDAKEVHKRMMKKVKLVKQALAQENQNRHVKSKKALMKKAIESTEDVLESVISDDEETN